MAKRTVTVMTDDIDGSEASQSIDFSYRGKAYTIDLNEQHAEELDEVMAPYISAAADTSRGGSRSSRSGGGSRSRPAAKSDGEPDPKKVRAWAEANGVEVSARGRISARVVEQYKAANA